MVSETRRSSRDVTASPWPPGLRRRCPAARRSWCRSCGPPCEEISGDARLRVAAQVPQTGGGLGYVARVHLEAGGGAAHLHRSGERRASARERVEDVVVS